MVLQQSAIQQSVVQEPRYAVQQLVYDNADVFYTDSAEPMTVKNYSFDLQLREGAKPYSATAPMLSPEQQRKEQHHFQKSLDMKHFVTPSLQKLGPWTAPARIVYKKDDPNGRLIMDFRMLNKSTILQ